MTEIKWAGCPFEQFEVWMREAIDSDEVDPGAFSLATASAQGRPSVRTLLYKGAVQHQGETVFAFYSNTCSEKGSNLAENPWAEILFYWPTLYRQIRVSGQVVPLSREQTVSYFSSRPLGSQISAAASQQGKEIASRSELLQKIEALRAEYQDKPVPCPAYWQGYGLLPDRFEFWVGQQYRLHDRFVYTKSEQQSWSIKCLAP